MREERDWLPVAEVELELPVAELEVPEVEPDVLVFAVGIVELGRIEE